MFPKKLMQDGTPAKNQTRLCHALALPLEFLHNCMYIYIYHICKKNKSWSPRNTEKLLNHLQCPIQIPSLLVLRLFGHLAGIHRIAAQSRLLMAVRHAPVPLLQAHLVSDQQKKWCNVEKYDWNLQIIRYDCTWSFSSFQRLAFFVKQNHNPP